jgi:hypothetical protein
MGAPMIDATEHLSEEGAVERQTKFKKDHLCHCGKYGTYGKIRFSKQPSHEIEWRCKECDDAQQRMGNT